MAQQLFVLSSSNFDGATPAVNENLRPSRGGNQPIASMTQDPLGRLSFYTLGRSGENSAVVQARRVGPGAGSMVVRSLSAVEVSEMGSAFRYQPAPAALDQPLKTVDLATELSGGVLLGPTDAITLADGAPGNMGTVELLLLTGEDICCIGSMQSAIEAVSLADQALALIQTLSQGATLTNAVDGGVVNAPVPSAPIFPLRISFSASGLVQLPALGDVPVNATYPCVRINGTGSLVGFRPVPGEPLDGIADQISYMRGGTPNVNATAETGCMVTRTSAGWVTTGTWTRLTLENPAGAYVIPPWAGEKVLSVTGAVSSNITLPLISAMPGRGAKLQAYAMSATHTFVCSGGDVISGRGFAFAPTIALPLRTFVTVMSFGGTSWVVT